MFEVRGASTRRKEECSLSHVQPTNRIKFGCFRTISMGLPRLWICSFTTPEFQSRMFMQSDFSQRDKSTWVFRLVWLGGGRKKKKTQQGEVRKQGRWSPSALKGNENICYLLILTSPWTVHLHKPTLLCCMSTCPLLSCLLFRNVLCAHCVCACQLNSVLDKYRRKPPEMFISRGIWVLNHNTTSRVFAFTFFGRITPSSHTHKQAITALPWHLGRHVTPPPTHSSAQEFYTEPLNESSKLIHHTHWFELVPLPAAMPSPFQERPRGFKAADKSNEENKWSEGWRGDGGWESCRRHRHRRVKGSFFFFFLEVEGDWNVNLYREHIKHLLS